MKISGVAAGGASSFAAESRGRGQLVLRRGFGHSAIAAGWIGLIPSRGYVLARYCARGPWWSSAVVADMDGESRRPRWKGGKPRSESRVGEGGTE